MCMEQEKEEGENGGNFHHHNHRHNELINVLGVRYLMDTYNLFNLTTELGIYLYIYILR